MRRIVMFNHVTADEYFAGTDGNLAWVVPDDELDQEATERMPGTDTILLGRGPDPSSEPAGPCSAGYRSP